jgi:hypothetical protein
MDIPRDMEPMEASDIIVTIRNGLVTAVSATNAKQIRTVFVKTVEDDEIHIKPCDPQEIPAEAVESHLFSEINQTSAYSA